MLRPTIQHRTVGLQPRDSGRLALPTETTESRDGRLSIPDPKTVQYSPFLTLSFIHCAHHFMGIDAPVCTRSVDAMSMYIAAEKVEWSFRAYDVIYRNFE